MENISILDQRFCCNVKLKPLFEAEFYSVTCVVQFLVRDQNEKEAYLNVLMMFEKMSKVDNGIPIDKLKPCYVVIDRCPLSKEESHGPFLVGC